MLARDPNDRNYFTIRAHDDDAGSTSSIKSPEDCEPCHGRVRDEHWRPETMQKPFQSRDNPAQHNPWFVRSDWWPLNMPAQPSGVSQPAVERKE
jgi:hypothetical protein